MTHSFWRRRVFNWSKLRSFLRVKRSTSLFKRNWLDMGIFCNMHVFIKLFGFYLVLLLIVFSLPVLMLDLIQVRWCIGLASLIQRSLSVESFGVSTKSLWHYLIACSFELLNSLVRVISVEFDFLDLDLLGGMLSRQVLKRHINFIINGKCLCHHVDWWFLLPWSLSVTLYSPLVFSIASCHYIYQNYIKNHQT